MCYRQSNLPPSLNSQRSLCASRRTVAHRGGGFSSIGATMVHPIRKQIHIKPINPRFLVTLECGHQLQSRVSNHGLKWKCLQCSPQWSEVSPHCLICKSTRRPHASKGRCDFCMGVIRNPRGDWSNFGKNRKYPVNDFLFDSWTERSAYLLGVLYAEGHICTNGNRGTIKIGLSTKDEGWLLQIREAFGCSNPIYRKIDKRHNCSLSDLTFASKRLNRIAREFGIKEHRMPPVPDEYFHHFARGHFDGDGSFYTDSQSGNLQSSFVGQFNFIEPLRIKLQSLVGTSPKVRPHPKATKINKCAAWSIRYASADTLKLGNFLYRNSTIQLTRKQDLFLKEKARKEQLSISRTP